MIKISATLIKELRSLTGAGFMECKKALLEEKGDIEKSIDHLRKLGHAKAQKKIHNITNYGVIFAHTKDNCSALLELNCETDFVAKDTLFQSFGKEVISTALSQNIREINELRSLFNNKRIDLINRINENINICNFSAIYNQNVTSYVHDNRIGVLVSVDNLNTKISKNIAMHIAASKPEYLCAEDVPHSIFDREYQIQLALLKNINKPDNILKKIMIGRMQKFTNSISLIGQDFVIDPTKTVGQLLQEYNAKVISFIRFEIGEKVINSLFI
ncbi:translation elongation factor Ts [Buchnera aphidicola]|uniref:translation elongation factor Ts n=1 Tax=Buchnera aphidicola TaxID=9 RepID=UPI003463EE59